MKITKADLDRLSPEQAEAWLKTLSEKELASLHYDWEFWARPEQLAPEGKWSDWLILAGRGFGKTRAGAEWVRERAVPGARIALVGPTAADTRDVMVEGESGILACSPPWHMPKYEPSKRQLSWDNGAIAKLYSAEEPERLRGPQHTDAWLDELCAWNNQRDTWDMLSFGLRLGDHPQRLITTTPKPQELIRALIADEKTVVSSGSTFDNIDNLAPKFREEILKKYEGTQLGRQELYAEILEGSENAYFHREWIDQFRVPVDDYDFERIVIGVDPTGGAGDDCGIVVCGKIGEYLFCIEDATAAGKPEVWARHVIRLYDRHQADLIVAERNFGGDMVESTLKREALLMHQEGKRRTKRLPVRPITSTRGKALRAEPFASSYEKGYARHIGEFPELEKEMVRIGPDFDKKRDGSPNRLDALVFALTELDSPSKPPPPRPNFVMRAAY